jgi:hypothetical protein
MSTPTELSDLTLEELGLEEAEPGCVEDTYENRRTLRQAKFQWEPVVNDDGPTGLIRCFSPAALVERRLSVWDRKRDILSDPANPWSDYLPAQELPANADVPLWVRAAIRRHVTDVSIGKPEPYALPVRCKTVRVDGTRCWNWAHRGDEFPQCRSHEKWSDKESYRLAIARAKLAQAAPGAVDTLEELMQNASGEAVRAKAAAEILDRAGVRAGMDVNVDVKVEQVDPAAVVRERLERLRESAAAVATLTAIAEPPSGSEADGDGADVVIDAEVVDDGGE